MSIFKSTVSEPGLAILISILHGRKQAQENQ